MKWTVGPNTKGQETSLHRGVLVTDDGFSAEVIAREAIDMARLMDAKSKQPEFVRVIQVELKFERTEVVIVGPDDSLEDTTQRIYDGYIAATGKRPVDLSRCKSYGDILRSQRAC